MLKQNLKKLGQLHIKESRADTSAKHTEKSMEAEIDTDPVVLEVQRRLIEAEHKSETILGAVESMRAKKDMLMQLGADARKEK